MKNKLILATLIMSCVFALTAFAAGWTNEEKGWRYYDKDGCEVTCEWKRSGDTWYYLDSEGYLLTDELVRNDDNSFSFVDETGARVANVWICRTSEEHGFDQNWLYIKANGRSVIAGDYTVNGKKYHFTDNKMDHGYLDENKTMIEDWTQATYYYSGADEGWAYSGWVKEFNAMGDVCWLYFNNGKITKNTDKTIDGKKYHFDADGIMVSGNIATNSEATKRWFDASGAIVKNSWIEIVSEETGDSTWKYAKQSGALVENGEYKINGKWYLFKDTVMQTGWQFDNTKYYLSSGARATGRQTISEKTYQFLTDGTKVVGEYKGYYYGTDGALKTNEDAQYKIIDGMLINNSGKIMKTCKVYHDTWTEKYYKVTETEVYECNSKGERK